MASTAAAIADAWVAWLNDPARQFRLTGWLAVRTWAPELDLPTLGDVPFVEVAPDDPAAEELATRGEGELTWTHFVGVRQKYAGSSGPVPNAFVDARAELAEQIAEQALNTAFTVAGLKVVCEQAVLSPLVDPTELRKYRTVVCVVAATCREWRSK